MRALTLGNKTITDDSDAWVIAEIGNNHQGSLETAKLMILKAAECGADAVKFQKRDNRTLYTAAMYNQPYNSENAFGATYGEHREALEFDWDQYVELKTYAESMGLFFFATAFDIPSADFLEALGVGAFKIASGCLTDLPLLRHIARWDTPIILSTGGGTLDQVTDAVAAIYGASPVATPELAILQCTAEYPADPADMNLRVIETYRQTYPHVIGLSDHQSGIAMAPVAYALGARIFEKHFTLNRAWKGADHAFSLEPQGLKSMIRDLRRVRLALGDGEKHPYEAEAPGLTKMSKSIVAAYNIAAGQTLTEGDLVTQSPAGGLPPTKLDKMLGRKTRADILAGETITSTGILL